MLVALAREYGALREHRATQRRRMLCRHVLFKEGKQRNDTQCSRCADVAAWVEWTTLPLQESCLTMPDQKIVLHARTASGARQPS